MAKARIVSSGGSGLAALAARASGLDRHAVSVGIHEDAGMHDKAGTTVAQVAAWNEYGTDTIPERSFMRTTMNERRNEHFSTLVRIVKRVIKGEDGAKLMGQLGQKVQNQVQAKVVSIQEPPNAAATIKHKKSSKPLVDTGQMAQSIKWEFVDARDTD